MPRAQLSAASDVEITVFPPAQPMSFILCCSVVNCLLAPVPRGPRWRQPALPSLLPPLLPVDGCCRQLGSLPRSLPLVPLAQSTHVLVLFCSAEFVSG